MIQSRFSFRAAEKKIEPETVTELANECYVFRVDFVPESEVRHGHSLSIAVLLPGSS